jgi:thiamine pyrophosphokinase
MKNKALIFLNGNAPDVMTLRKIDFSASFVICADGAYNYLRGFCRPDLVIGDFDSLQSDLPADIDFEKYPVKKDYTDSQLALRRAVEFGYKDIEIYGAFGDRPDHVMVNYSLLALADKMNCRAAISGEKFDVYYVTCEKPFIKTVESGKTVSLVPYSDRAHILYTKGLMFDARDVWVDKTAVFTTSNVATGGTVEYVLKDGTALLFVEN